MNNLQIKICGMRDPENVEQILEYTPNFLGFIFYEHSPRFVTDTEMKKINELDFQNTLKVGVFVNESLDKVIDQFEKYALDYVQLHGEESVNYVKTLKEHEISIIKTHAVDEAISNSLLYQYEEYIDYFLFDTKSKLRGGSGVKFNWKALENYTLSTGYFLSGGLLPADIQSIKKLKLTQLLGADLNSKLEVKPGIKSHIAVNELFKYVNKNQTL